MISNTINIPECCACCSKPIRAGHPFIVCRHCNCMIHKKCRTNLNIINFRDETYCQKCCDDQDIVRYNPFYQPPHFENNDLLDDEPIDYIHSIGIISNILETCKTFNISQLNSSILSSIQKNFLSTLFLNIDGNATNFDSFAAQISQFKHNFSVIGLAETNTDTANSCLFPLKDSSCYQNRFFNYSKNQPKDKGTGVCLYVHNSLNFTKICHLSMCKESIESLFITITSLPEPIIVGVIYRPPNSSLNDYNAEYEKILSELHGKKILHPW